MATEASTRAEELQAHVRARQAELGCEAIASALEHLLAPDPDLRPPAAASSSPESAG